MWRQESQAAIRKQMMRAPSAVTVGEVAVEWLAAAQSGRVRTRSGTPYKPSALRSHERELRRRVLPEFGQMRLSSLTRNMVQDFADRLVGEGCSPSGVRNAILPLRAIYRRAVDRGEVDLNLTLKLSLPAVPPRRERVPRASEAAALIAAVPLSDRAVWAITAAHRTDPRVRGIMIGGGELESTINQRLATLSGEVLNVGFVNQESLAIVLCRHGCIGFDIAD